MLRRDFSMAMAATIGLIGTHQAQAQTPSKGYLELKTPLATNPQKVEVIEFFMYSCPHCFALEKSLNAWVAQLPSHAQFRRVPVAFRPNLVIHQRLFYALDTMGKLSAFHGKIFEAIHVKNQPLDTDEAVLAFVNQNGMTEEAKFKSLFDANSFSINTKIKQAAHLAEGYQIDGVPSLGVHGKYLVTTAQAGSPEGMLTVAKDLVMRLRKKA
jgi:protein dithiol oxidoreductase (disulfide-forming)